MDEITGKRSRSSEYPPPLTEKEKPSSDLHAKIPKLEEEKTTSSLVGRAAAIATSQIEQIMRTQFSQIAIKLQEGDTIDAIFTKPEYNFELLINDRNFKLRTDKDVPTTQITYEFVNAHNKEKFYLKIRLTETKEELDKLKKEGACLLLMQKASHVLGAVYFGAIENVIVSASKTPSGFSLFDFLTKDVVVYSLSQKLSILLDIAKGVKELHDAKLIHGNLHVKNIFTNYRTTALITDLSNCIPTEEVSRIFSGYIDFKAPEVLNCHPSVQEIPTESFLKEPHTTAVDIYSFGMLIHVLLEKKTIFNVLSKTNDLIMHAIFARITKNINIPELTISSSSAINTSLKNLIQDCLRLNPKERPLIDNVIKQLEKILTESKMIPPSSPPTFAEISVTQGFLDSTSFTIPNHRFSVAVNGTNFDLEGLGLTKEGKIIGSGAFGRVFINQEKTIAVKAIIPKNFSEIKRVEQEAYILLQLKNAKYALGAFSVGFEGSTLFAFMDYIKGTTLKEKIKTPKSLSLEQKTEILLGIVLGLQEVHAIGFVHRDVKPDNIIVDEQYKARVIDFGLSFEVTPLNNKAGTPIYMAPEVLVIFAEDFIKKSKIQIDLCLNQEKGFPIDIYSFGLVAHELLENQRIEDLFARLTKNILLPKDSYKEYSISPRKRNLFIELVEGCLKLDPKERLSIPQIISKIQEIKSLD